MHIHVFKNCENRCHVSLSNFVEAYVLFYDLIYDVDFYTGTHNFTICDEIFKMYKASVILCMTHKIIFRGEYYFNLTEFDTLGILVVIGKFLRGSQVHIYTYIKSLSIH